MSFTDELIPPSPPPASARVNLLTLIRTRLFGSIGSTIVSVLILYLLIRYVPPLLNWLIFSADWIGTSREDCTSGGACWAVITARFRLFIVGFYPAEQVWRVWIAFTLLPVALGYCLVEKLPYRRYGLTFAGFYPLITAILLAGGLGLPEVATSKWGGLLLTLVCGLTGIVVSLPLGVILALGRRSNLPAISSLCVIFIEFIRGVPLITILFMSSVMLPLFLPPGTTMDQMLRALVGISLFASAYMAEVIRSGLQSIPKGQYEAADALGLGYWQSMRLIILPQALKIVIPGIVSTFISLFKDTSLVLIIGLYDLLGIANATITDTKWIGLSNEVYVFTALVYWVFCFSMSRYSLYLEDKLHKGHKKK
ncbi:amino acid ABC transporter permease [Ruegeria sp. ANG-R]|uniref:amino acid ABC transporter permease n=1 Tax=Ruegeria sp. ANG-R TaxID=1577903 RepID=UPI0005809C36|nr:amino acid ABC transporter permease [Ruegeria sp. ANG-R]KIC41379.1 amino acid ABC transporter permease [Ruegeria sp. ANG-R]